ncbi:endothelin-converting enzyme homolog [Cochliomyia hominivorax]
METQIILIKILLISQYLPIINGSKWLPFVNIFRPRIQTQMACSDFYEYACKNYNRLNRNPNYSEITQKLEYEMTTMLTNRMSYLARHQQQMDHDRIFTYMDSCVNVKRRDMRKYCEEIKPNDEINWPLLAGNGGGEGFELKEDFNVWNLLGCLQGFGLNNVILHYEIVRNEKNSLEVRLGRALKDQEEFFEQKNVFEVLLKALQVSSIRKKVDELQRTENEWLNFAEQWNATDNEEMELSPKELTLYYPRLKLSEYLEQLLGVKEIENISLVIIENPRYFWALNEKSWTKRDVENLCNYLLIRFLYYVSKDGPRNFSIVECTKDLKNKLDLAVSLFYYNHFYQHWGDKYLAPFNQMLVHIKQTIFNYFQENQLNLTPDQMQYLKEKLLDIKVNIGNLPDNFNNQTIEEYYQDLPDLSKENFYKNHLQLLKHRFRKSLVNPQKETYFVASTNGIGSISSPYYVPQQNMVIIPYATLRLSFFNYSDSPLQQLSLLGFVLSHEISHAFDTTGLLYDRYGYPLTSPSGILNDADFKTSLKCMQQQEPTENIDERISDLFAIHIIYRTYQEFYAKNDTNWKQDFFKNLAQFFCGRNDLRFIDHDSDQIRLQQIVKNFKPFAQAFGCEEGSPMNPKQKCRLY